MKWSKKDYILYSLGLGLILIVVWLIMSIAINRAAIDPETLASFKFIKERSLFDFWRGETFPGHFVAYRPIMASLFKIEYLLVGFNSPIFFLTDIILICVLAYLIYDVIYRKTRNLFPSIIATLFFVTDWRHFKNIYIITEAQATLAGIFGLLALWIVWFSKIKRRNILIFFLLLASVLSKEFGLAFSLAVFIFALYERPKERKSLIAVSISVVVIFIGIRLSLGELPSTSSDFSFLTALLNMASGFFFSFIPLFITKSDGDLPSLGDIHFPPAEAKMIILFQILPIVILFLMGFKDKENRRITIPVFFIIVGNSVLFFFRYAYRFHFIGNIGIYLIAGFGINHIYNKMREQSQMLDILIAIIISLILILQWRGEYFHNYLAHLVSLSDQALCTREMGLSEREVGLCMKKRELCIPTEEYYLQENFGGYYSSTDPDTVVMIMEYYNMPLEACSCLDPDPTCK
jgi:hypothetical protein